MAHFIGVFKSGSFTSTRPIQAETLSKAQVKARKMALNAESLAKGPAYRWEVEDVREVK